MNALMRMAVRHASDARMYRDLGPLYEYDEACRWICAVRDLLRVFNLNDGRRGT